MTAEEPIPLEMRPAWFPATPPMRRWFLLVAGLAAVAAAAGLPYRPAPGLSWGVVAALMFLALCLAGAVGRGGYPLALGAAGLTLASSSAWRDAGWLVAIDLLAAVVLWMLAANPPGTWLGWAAALAAPAWRSWLVPAWLYRAAAIVAPERWRIGNLTRGILLGSVLVMLFGTIFASADAVFRLVVTELLPDWKLGRWVVRLLAFGLVGGCTAALALGGLMPVREKIVRWLPELDGTRPDRRQVDRIQWITALSLLTALFASFVVVQVTALLAGHEHILRTAGLTYAEYAREGFFQLLVATGMTMVVLAAFWNRSAVGSKGDRLLLRALLGLLCVLTLVILASALRRLGLYEQAYGFTRARLAAHALAWWIGLALVMLLAAGAHDRSGWLVGGFVITAATGLLIFTAVNPDRLIAERNLQRYEQTGKIDIVYLSNLSADAVPALLDYPDGLRAELLLPMRDSLGKPEPWTSLNLSRRAARAALDIGR